MREVLTIWLIVGIAELAEAQKVSIQQFTATEKVEFRGAMTTAAKTIAGEALENAARALQVAASSHDNAMKQEKTFVTALVGHIAAESTRLD